MERVVCVESYLRERAMNRTRNRSQNLLIRIWLELFSFSSKAALAKWRCSAVDPWAYHFFTQPAKNMALPLCWLRAVLVVMHYKYPFARLIFPRRLLQIFWYFRTFCAEFGESCNRTGAGNAHMHTWDLWNSRSGGLIGSVQSIYIQSQSSCSPFYDVCIRFIYNSSIYLQFKIKEELSLHSLYYASSP